MPEQPVFFLSDDTRSNDICLTLNDWVLPEYPYREEDFQRLDSLPKPPDFPISEDENL